MADVSLVVHGHFYQPPRENPWTERVPVEPSAAPFHDWNERITAECYRPNGWARIVDDHGRVVDIVDNYERLSFNVGPTLLSWLEEHEPAVYDRILDADRRSGRAIAQGYGHAILPLCNERDLRTQVRWGLADFSSRFGRRAEGMWLPETAVSDAVLAVLAEEGVQFTILAPTQIEAVRELEGGEWVDFDGVSTHRPLRWRHPERPGLGVDLVVYDGDLSHGLAFGGVASEALVARAIDRSGEGGLVCAATDGETFGHHHRYGDRGLAYALAVEADRRGVAVPRLVDAIAARPPTHEARVRTSAWSCAHGVGRWMTDCGCHTGGEPGWSQSWRAPLREALDHLRDWGIPVTERLGRELFTDVWAARDAYLPVVLGTRSADDFLAEHGRDGADPVAALTLMEAQRNALLMYTSCGWFFNDLAGLETVQILRYAARAVDLFAELGEDPPLDGVLAVLARARSNRPDEGDGAQVWRAHVEPSRVDAGRVVAHLALVDLLGDPAGDGDGTGVLGAHLVERGHQRAADRGGLALRAGTVELVHRRTRRRTRHAYAALHLGGLEVFGAVRELQVAGDEPVGDRAAPEVVEAVDALARAVEDGERVTALLRRVVEDFGPREFGLESALPDAAGQIVERTAAELVERVAAAYDQFRADHRATFTALAQAGYPVPGELRAPVELALAHRVAGDLADAVAGGDGAARRSVAAFARSARAEGFSVASPRAAEVLRRGVERAVAVAVATHAVGDDPGDAVDEALELVVLAGQLDVAVDLDRAQELLFEALGPPSSRADVPEALARLGAALGVA